MPIDLGKINSGNTSDTVLHPREIFTALPNKDENSLNFREMVKQKFGIIGSLGGIKKI